MANLPRCSYTRTLLLLPQPEKETIIVFTSITCESGRHALELCTKLPGPILYSRFSYTGECLNSCYLPCPAGLTNIVLKPVKPMCIPTSWNGKFLIRASGVFKSEPPQGGPDCMDLHLQFDERLNHLTIIDHPISPRRQCSIAWWNDTFYGSDLGIGNPCPLDSLVILALLGTRYVITSPLVNSTVQPEGPCKAPQRCAFPFYIQYSPEAVTLQNRRSLFLRPNAIY